MNARMHDRRQFLGAMLLPSFAAVRPARLDPRGMLRAFEALGSPATEDRSAEEVARDESVWSDVQRAFSVDRSLINLNNGGVSPSPSGVQEAMKRYLDFSNAAPVHTMWQVLQPQKETIRRELARELGCDAEELAITRNASEGLQICQLGLDLSRGDEILTTNQDYPRMLTTFEQRARREGVVLKKISIPTPCEDEDEIVRRFAAELTPRTRVILACHVINLTGQILPIAALARLARSRGVPLIVDGAHAFAHFPYQIADLECDYYATSLHKWLFAPHGTGFLFVRSTAIPGLWPMMAAPEKLDRDIRKFEEIGTHPVANYLSIGEALSFHRGIGAERKAARLRALRDRWAGRLLEHERIRLHTSLKPQFSCGLATVQVEGVDAVALCEHLWNKHRILTTAIVHEEFQGLRITPSVYTTLPELDRFCEAIELVLRDGLPQ
jgi:selenocysteine lyase/cysteine desulfurase